MSKQKDSAKLQQALSVFVERTGMSRCMVRDVISRHGGGLCDDSIISKLRDFSGQNVADLCAHFQQRNVGTPRPYGQWRVELPSLDQIERRS